MRGCVLRESPLPEPQEPSFECIADSVEDRAPAADLWSSLKYVWVALEAQTLRAYCWTLQLARAGPRDISAASWEASAREELHTRYEVRNQDRLLKLHMEQEEQSSKRAASRLSGATSSDQGGCESARRSGRKLV